MNETKNESCKCATPIDPLYTELSFSTALSWLKQGKRVRRVNWDFSYLIYLPPIPKADFEGSIRVWVIDHQVLTDWVPNQSDLLAEDWEVV